MSFRFIFMSPILKRAYIYIYIHTIYTIYTIYIYTYTYIHSKANDDEKVNLFYLKFKIFIYIQNKYSKSVFTLNTFQDTFSSVKFLQYKSCLYKQQQ